MNLTSAQSSESSRNLQMFVRGSAAERTVDRKGGPNDDRERRIHDRGNFGIL